ncbi:MAG: VanZ family protein, partial [Acidimicrobiia bacterium]|nr:VanZ family protein [Acidimicrobiia bacterium]
MASRLPNIPGVTGRGESVALSGHFLSTLVLAALVFALIRARDLDRRTARVAFATFLVAVVVGGGIEILQGFSRTRTPELVDWLFDSLGAVVGIAVMVTVDIQPPHRPGLVTAAHVFGAGVAALAVSAFFVWPPIPAAELTSYCPQDVQERKVPVAPIEVGTGTRISDGLLVLYTFQDSADDVSGLVPGLDLELSGG